MVVEHKPFIYEESKGGVLRYSKASMALDVACNYNF